MKRNFGNKGKPVEPPRDGGCYVYGLWLDAANWSDEEERLVDCDGK